MDTLELATDEDFRIEVDFLDFQSINVEIVCSNELPLVEHRSTDNSWSITDTRSSLWLRIYRPLYYIEEEADGN
jgi:hypothetical protein